MDIIYVNSKIKSTHLEINLFRNKTVFIVLKNLDNYSKFNVLLMSRIKVLISAKKINEKEKTMDIEINITTLHKRLLIG